MFARVSTYQGTPESVAQSLTRTTDIVERVEKLAGLKGVYYLVDRDSGKSMSITLWETESDLQTSVEAANQIRSQEAATDDAEILAVEHFEVATAELR